MRFRLPLLAFAALLLPISAMTVISACGTTSDNTIVDAANDNTTKDVTVDVAPDVAPEAGCTNDANINTLIPDGGLVVDGGGNLGACTNCLANKCKAQINGCNADCYCRQGVQDAITCFLSGTSFQTCATDAVTSGNSNLTALFGCAAGQCLAICTAGVGDGGTDGSTDAAGDGG